MNGWPPQLHTQGVVPVAGARLNTETPGSVIDRLSIAALRIYHMEEQAARTSASLGHRAKARSRLEILLRQHHDLAQSLAELLDDLFAGRKRLEIYRQFKMYNDPTLNPQIYGGDKADADNARSSGVRTCSVTAPDQFCRHVQHAVLMLTGVVGIARIGSPMLAVEHELVLIVAGLEP